MGPPPPVRPQGQARAASLTGPSRDGPSAEVGPVCIKYQLVDTYRSALGPWAGPVGPSQACGPGPALWSGRGGGPSQVRGPSPAMAPGRVAPQVRSGRSSGSSSLLGLVRGRSAGWTADTKDASWNRMTDSIEHALGQVDVLFLQELGGMGRRQQNTMLFERMVEVLNMRAKCPPGTQITQLGCFAVLRRSHVGLEARGGRQRHDHEAHPLLTHGPCGTISSGRPSGPCHRRLPSGD